MALGSVVEVAEGVYAYVQHQGTWWVSNAGFVVGGGGVVSIDSCATERRTRAYLDAIEAHGVGPVTTLVNTHQHGDHTNGNCLFEVATVIGHRQCRAGVLATPIGGREEIFGVVDWGDLELRAPDVTFDARLDVHAGETLIELHHFGAPAHTGGDVVAWLPEHEVLFAGDLVFNGSTPFFLRGSLVGSLAALDHLRELGASTIVPGHGPVGGPELLDQVADYLGWIQQVAEAMVDAGIAPLEAARQTDLGPFAAWGERERLVANLRRAQAEALGQELDETQFGLAYQEMVAFNGGRALRCLA